jgi:hypothetical protein
MIFWEVHYLLNFPTEDQLDNLTNYKKVHNGLMLIKYEIVQTFIPII